MPWFFTIPEFLKKRACRYLLQHYLGQFLEERICLDDLTVDLYNGTGSIHNVPLNVQAINDVLVETGAPLKVISGYLGCVTVSVPWTALLTESSTVQVSELTLTVAPDLQLSTGEEAASMTDSLLFNMTSSMQLAEEVLKSGPSPGESDPNTTSFEGMETLAKAIELVLARVQIKLTDATVQVNYKTADQEHFIKATVGNIEFYDELSRSESSVDSEGAPGTMQDFSTKVLQLSGLAIELGTRQLDSQRMEQTDSLEDSMTEYHGVPIATASGQLSLKVKIKQNDTEPGPKLEVEGHLGSLHLLLSPQQLGTLVEMAIGISNQGNEGSFEKLAPGQSRPIPKSDMKTIESQLARHQQKEQKVKAKLEQREDLFHADPWNNSLGSRQRFTESSHSAMDDFYSLDLNTSVSTAMTQSVSLEDSYMSTDSKSSGYSRPDHIHSKFTSNEALDIPLHPGVGLQQLSQGAKSPGKRFRSDSGASNFTDSSPKSGSQVECRCNLTFGGVTVALLETKPVYMFSGPELNTESSEGSFSSIDNGGLDPLRYFDSVCSLLSDGISRQELKSKDEELSQVLPSDHLLLWLSTVKATVSTSSSGLSSELTVASAELWEYLYRNTDHLNRITKPVAVCPILQLFEDSSVSPPLPCVKLKLSTLTHKKQRKSPRECDQTTSLDLRLASLHLIADVTLVDRLQPIISALSSRPHYSLKSSSLEKVKQSLYMTTSNFHSINMHRQALFTQATEATAGKEHNLNIKISANAFNVSLRFPIPELKSTQRPPWYLPSLRSEVLYASLESVCVSSHLKHSALTGEGPFSVDATVESVKVYLSQDGSIENRELFLTVSASSQTPNRLVNGLHARLVAQPPTDSALAQGVRKTGGLDDMHQSLDEEFGLSNEPSPFSARKTMFSTTKTDPDSSSRNEEQVLPGSPRELRDFQNHVSDSAQYCVSLALPVLRLHLPSSHFLEVLYNRFAMDMALWEPAESATVERATAHSMMLSCMDLLQPAATSEDRFSMCKSVLKEEDSDEESVDEGVGPKDHTHQDAVNRQSFLALSVTVEDTAISMSTQQVTMPDADSSGVEHKSMDSTVFHSAQSVAQLLDLGTHGTSEPGPTSASTGLAVFRAARLNTFTVLGYEGDPTHDYFSAQITEFSLHHSGSVSEAYSCVLRPLNDSPPISSLVPVVYQSCARSGQELDPMLAIAVEMRLNKDRNSKTNKCSIALSNTTVQYHMTAPEHNCFKQLGDFFSLTEETVAGYEAPSTITELHTHLKSVLLEYKPLHLPLHALVSLDSVSLSTSLVTGAPVMVCRLITDGTHLLLAHQQYESPDPKQGFVCVLEMSWFELTLRLCNNEQLGDDYEMLFSRMPDISVECSSNVLHLRTCADSLIALRDLLVYLSTNGDLQAPLGEEQTGLRDYTSLGQEPPSLQSQNSQQSTDSSPLASLTDTPDIGDLISDAMEDLPGTDHSQPTKKRSGDKKRPPMGVHVESDKSVVVDFCSDSSDDENDFPVADGRGKERPPSPANKMTGAMYNSIFSDSDDDFCIVDKPTSTKVGPGSRPQVKSLLGAGESVEFVDNHFSLPDGDTDQLQRPKHFPEPISQFTLKEMTIIWHMYGGSDFSPPSESCRSRSGSTSSSKKPGASPSLPRKYGSSPGADYVKIPQPAPCARVDWRAAGGPARQHNKLVEIELDKLRICHERYPADTEQASRLVLLVHDLELRDRLRASSINKLLYQYTTESEPKQSHANMVSLKVLFSRPELLMDPNLEEASVRLSILPIRLNIDQDTVMFLFEFAKSVGNTAPIQTAPVRFSQSPKPSASLASGATPDPQRRGSGESTSHKVFIKSFIFQPDLPIRIDYEAKGFKTEMGTLAGILLGLSHLNTSEVRLKALTNKKGVLGWDKLLEYSSSEWASDIKAYQLPLILKGVGPMHHVTQLVHGMVDLFWLPYQQYQEDGRIMWGLQQGASSFTSSTGVAIVELSSRLLESVQSYAQMAYDMVTPTECPSTALVHQHKPHEPLDFREGFSNAYDVVSAGIGGTARDMYSAAAREHEERGVTGAVGGVLRQIPGTIVKPIILASEATRHVLGGVKNQFVPDARKEASEKWRNENSEQS